MTYYYRIAAFNPGGNSAEGNQAVAKPVAPPAVPTGLTATARRRIAFIAARLPMPESVTPIATQVVGTTYVDSAVVSGTKYYYRIAAFNVGGNSAEGNQASATP